MLSVQQDRSTVLRTGRQDLLDVGLSGRGIAAQGSEQVSSDHLRRRASKWRQWEGGTPDAACRGQPPASASGAAVPATLLRCAGREGPP